MPITEYKTLAGITLTAPGRPSLVMSLISLKLPEFASQEIKDTDLSSTAEKSFAGAVKDYGEVSGVARYKPAMAIPLGQDDEVFRITYPLVGSQTVAGTLDFIGHFTKAGSPEATTDGRAEAPFTIKVNSKPIFTEGY